jgi:hypothetical protein
LAITSQVRVVGASLANPSIAADRNGRSASSVTNRRWGRTPIFDPHTSTREHNADTLAGLFQAWIEHFRLADANIETLRRAVERSPYAKREISVAVVSWSSYPLKNVACPPRDEGHSQPQRQ